MNRTTTLSFPRGSEWRCWDLQIQPIKNEWFLELESKKYEIKNATKEYLKKAVEKEIKVVAITDHNTGLAVDLALEILQEENLDVYIFAGVEIETPEGWHCLVIFNPDYKESVNCSDWHNVIQTFLRNVGNMSGRFFNDDGTARQVEIHTKDLIREVVQRDIGVFIFAHCDADKGFFRRGNNTTRKEIVEESIKDDLRFVFDTKDSKVVDIQTEVRNIISNQNYKLEIPVVSTSDAHQPEEMGKFTWIKADPTYDGLKQILYEPKQGERVFIGDIPPTFKNPSKVIDKIEVKNSKKWFGAESILLNENLISVIGEKGSGKTALADLIAFAGGDFTLDEKDQASFLYKALIPTKQITETIEDCEVIIHWKNGEQDTVTVNRDLSNYQTKKKVKYLSQSFIEKGCRPENFEELQREIEDIIFQHIPASDRLGETTFDGLRKRRTEEVEIQKNECRRNLSELNNEIFSLEEDIASLGARKEEVARLEKEQAELEAQKPKATTEKEKEIEKRLSLLNQRKNTLDEQIANLKSQLVIIGSIKTKISTLKSYAEKQLSQIVDDLKKLGLTYKTVQFAITPDFTEALNAKEEEINKEIDALRGAEEARKTQADEQGVKLEDFTEEKIEKLSLNDTERLIKKLESISTIVESTRKAIKEYDEKISKIKARVRELKKSIDDIEKVKIPSLPQKEKARSEAYKEYFKLLAEEKGTLEELYASLKDKAAAKNDNQMEFFARIELDVENFFRKAQEILDFSRRGKYYRAETALFEAIKNIGVAIELGEVEDIPAEMEKLCNSFKEDRENKKIDIQSQLCKGKKKLDFYNWIFDTSDFKVAYNIKYQGTSLELLSPGKKGVVLLLMYLVLDTENSVPLIIDQPEENLDNKSVFPSLVDYFREIKRRRQVIVITHNPNLVLNTDAEQVVVANFDAVPTTQLSRISYVSGAIENSFVSRQAKIPLEQRGIREHGLDILEGGKTAFKKRREKYGKTAE